MDDNVISVSFIVLGEEKDISGGHIYNKRIVHFFPEKVNCELIYVSNEEKLIDCIDQAKGVVLVDAWGLHNIQPSRLNKPFHLLAHHPIELDDTVRGDHKKEENFWEKALSIITTSEYVKEFIENKCNTYVKSILPGIDPILREGDYSQVPSLIVGFASLIERKGDLLLLEAMKASLPVRIKRYGPAPDKDYLKQITTKSQELTVSSFLYEGLISEIEKEKILATADLAVFPTFYESFGMAIQECLESKIPVLVNDFVGARERFGELGVRYIEPEAMAWKEAINKYCHNENEYAQLIKEVKQRPHKFGSWASQSQLLANHFIKLCQSK